MTIDEDEFFENLSQLVTHYKLDADGLCTQLTQPLKNESAEGGKNGGYHDVDLKAFKEAGWVIEEKDIKVSKTFLFFHKNVLYTYNKAMI